MMDSARSGGARSPSGVASKALIFDFGNVVAFFDHQRASRQLASLSGEALDERAVYQAIFGTSLEDDFDCGRITADSFLQKIQGILGSDAGEAEILSAWCDIFSPNDAVISLLPRLRKASARLVLASNTNELHFQWISTQFADALQHMDEFVVSFRLGARKPAPRFFEACIEVAGVAAEQCVYVDDRPDFVQVAVSMGMSGIAYRPDVDMVQALRLHGVESG